MKYLSGLGTIPWPIMGSMAVCRELKSGGNITTLSPAIVQLPVRFVREPRTRQCKPGLKHNVAELIGLVVRHGMELRPVVSRIITRTGRVTERAKGRFEVRKPLGGDNSGWAMASRRSGRRPRRAPRLPENARCARRAACVAAGVHRRCLPHCWQADSPGC